MKFILDEGMPVPLLEPIRRNVPHEFQHIDELNWKSKSDEHFFKDAAKRGFDGVLTVDVDQLSDPRVCRFIKDSGLHHVSLRQGRTVKGLSGLARVIASFVVAMPYVIQDLSSDGEQRVVELELLGPKARHKTFDPRRERQRFPYWP